MLRFYLHCRTNVSLLLAEGHLAARRYPLGFMWSEARLVRRRLNARMATEAVLMQSVVASVIAGGDHLQALLGRLHADD